MQTTFEELSVGVIASYHKAGLSPFFDSCRLCVFWSFFGIPFVFQAMVSAISFY
jgi:hypothetical protein